ncbi:pseudouridine synthase [Shewanella sp. C32]|uniref:Pseudouridine synthase n=1 Tax=Shewanella electrica TaxID=515560 RepID=A0ABT2FQ19_9GAMM|nr:pseudouridine synthase [Shewanella electrica]MCH1925727.1 pseudouridine synthase [Shewanella electrica]MCS4558446.1 pseudouridine synthase [Shewanella electrica]
MSTATSIAAQPSYVVLPQQHSATTVLAFLIERFPQIDAAVWQARLRDGKVHWQDGSLIDAHTPYRAGVRVYYYREVASETPIPVTEQILAQDAHSLIVYKPHFLPVTPGGQYVNECLINRLRRRTGIDTIIPAHRLDRDTAGVMLLAVSVASRDPLHALFRDGQIHKTYQAVAALTPELAAKYGDGVLAKPQFWTVRNRIEVGSPSFTMRCVAGEANSHSEICLLAVKQGLGLFALRPVTGKTHQLRLHMQSLGMPLLHDRFYPELQPKQADDYSKPLKLVACCLRFTDPFTEQLRDVRYQGFEAEFGMAPLQHDPWMCV